MINQKKAKKLRRLIGVKSRANRTYMTADGKHHTQPFAAAHHKTLGSIGFFGAVMQVRLSKNEPRSAYQRIKRTGIAGCILAAGAL